MKKLVSIGAMMSLVPLCGCATLPDATVQYYPVKATLKLVTIETVACDTDKKLVLAASTTATLAGAADRDAAVIPIKIKAPSSSVSDLDSSFTFTDDGRLKGVNVTTTGAGEEIVKSAISIAGAAFSLMVDGSPEPMPVLTDERCKSLLALGDKGPPTLTFTGSVEFGASTPQQAVVMQPDEVAQLALAIAPAIPKPDVKISPAKTLEPAATGVVGSGDVDLKLQRLASVTATVSVPHTQDWTQEFTVPTAENFSLPIPRGKLFGKQSFSLTLSDVGAITAVGYGRTSAAAGSLGAVGGVMGLFTPSSVAGRDTDAADRIAAQERLVKCKADHATCPSK
jgi:hypothetical protein